MPTETRSRDEELLRSRIDGETFKTLSERHRLGVATIHRQVTAHQREHLNAVVDGMLVLQGQGRAFSVVIPAEPETARPALRYVAWLAEKLPAYFAADGLRLDYGSTEDGSLVAAFIDTDFEHKLAIANQGSQGGPLNDVEQ